MPECVDCISWPRLLWTIPYILLQDMNPSWAELQEICRIYHTCKMQPIYGSIYIIFLKQCFFLKSRMKVRLFIRHFPSSPFSFSLSCVCVFVMCLYFCAYRCCLVDNLVYNCQEHIQHPCIRTVSSPKCTQPCQETCSSGFWVPNSGSSSIG